MPVYKFTDGRKGWYFQFYFEGKKIKKERWNKEHMNSKAQAIAAEHECKQQLLNDKAKKQGNLTLYELYEEYVKTSKSTLKESTTGKNYATFKKVYLPLIEDKMIYNLTPADITEWKNKVVSRKISIDYKNRVLRMMRACLNYGLLVYNLPGNLQLGLLDNIKEHSVVEYNDSKELFIPEDAFHKICAPLLEEVNNGLYYYTIYNLMYYTGLRIGEVAALLLSDFKDKCIIVNKDLVRVGGKDIIQSPKNTNSIRKITLDDKTIELLNRYIEVYKPKNVLFKLKGAYLNQQKTRSLLKRLTKIAGLDDKYDIHPHSLRHSHSSNLRKLGFDEYVIAKRLGNTPKVSASTYIHSDESEQLEVAAKLRN